MQCHDLFTWKALAKIFHFLKTNKITFIKLPAVTSWQIQWLTEDACEPLGQKEAVDGHVVNWDPGQCEEAAHARVEGVRIQRHAHDEETSHREGDCDEHWDLWVRWEKSRHDDSDQSGQGSERYTVRRRSSASQHDALEPWRVSGGEGSGGDGWASPGLTRRWRTSEWRRRSWWAGRFPRWILSKSTRGTEDRQDWVSE